MRIEETASETIVHCGTHVDISTVVDQKEILLQVLQLKKPIRLEANEISKIDTAGAQLLLSFISTATIMPLNWQWQNPSTKLLNLSELLGLNKLLNLKQIREG